MRTNSRAVGIVIQKNKILLLHRVKNGQEYFVFPGGGVESDETIEQALTREMNEELSLNVKSFDFLFQIVTRKNLSEPARVFYFYLIDEYEGEPKLGGPEKQNMHDKNQYHPRWINISDMAKMSDIFPEDAKIKLLETLKAKNL